MKFLPSAGFLLASRLPTKLGPSGGAQTHEPRGPKPRVLSTELHPGILKLGQEHKTLFLNWRIFPS